MLVLTRLALVGVLLAGGFRQIPAQNNANQSYWDKVYTAATPVFVQAPNKLLVWATEGRQPGRALDIGMGQGRNAIFLAQKGWNVTGFDPAAEGVRLAKQQARKLGVPLEAFVCREEDFDLGSNRWDLIVMSYVRRLTAVDANRFWNALRPGGMLVYENNNTGPQNELLRNFMRFRILRFEDVDTIPDWHPDHKMRVERLVAEKPAGS